MIKVHLAASAALVLCASVCSALDMWTDYGYQGDLCRIATKPADCIEIPQPCSANVRSVG
ncbi:hypothetical protein BGX31_007501, partial [Mortierella sp. GBA43]